MFMLIESKIRKLALTVSFLQGDDLRKFLKRWLLEVREQEEVMEEIILQVAKAYQPFKKYEEWIERRITRNPDVMPKRVAYECRYYLHIKPQMMPYLIKAAQRIKRKVKARQRRSRKKDEFLQ
jgi:hypothetical protein